MMKLKYYLRGLGIGILVTVLLLTITSGRRGTMTDEEIKERARELGMTEGGVLADIANQTPNAAGTPETTPETEETPTATPTPTPTPSPTKTPAAGDTVTIVISSGQSSGAVSKTLEEAELVEDAKEYDKYLCANGYDKKIRAGSYEIPKGASDEEIALIITRSSKQ